MDRVIRNHFQNPATAADVFRRHAGAELFSDIGEADRTVLIEAFAKRHPITHNLGIVDRKYLECVQTGDLQGRDVRIGVPEVERTLDIVSAVLKGVYRRIYGTAAAVNGRGHR